MTKLFDLQGKTAIITGASSGLGEQFAGSLLLTGTPILDKKVGKSNIKAVYSNRLCEGFSLKQSREIVRRLVCFVVKLLASDRTLVDIQSSLSEIGVRGYDL